MIERKMELSGKLSIITGASRGIGRVLAIIIVGLVISHVSLGDLAVRGLVWTMVASGYGFARAFTIGAWKSLED
jgi:NAD(P)-dependent dehydrogenase (short-subunit alcohol dehydrogenase family)